MGCGRKHDQRGNSYLVGVALLVGLVLSGALLVLVAGQSIMDDTQGDAEAEAAGQTFQQVDQAFQSASRQDTNGTAEVELPEDVEGDVELNSSSTWRMRLDGNPDCTTLDRNLGALEYEDNDNVVGYEGGGVWKMTDSGATMETPPDLTYRNGSLNVEFPNMTGSVNQSDRVTASSNVSRSAISNRNLTVGLYTSHPPDHSGPITDVACAPTDVEQGTLWINDSQYAGAWAEYFRTNYPDHLVRVQSDRPVEAGDSVKVTFMLGDVSRPDYNVTAMNVTRGGADEDVEITANITNEGGLDGDPEYGLAQDVTISYSNAASDTVTNDSMEIRSGERENVTITISGPDPTPGTYEIEVQTENDTRTLEIELDDQDGTTDLQIDADAPQNATTRSDASVDVELDNDGDMTAYQQVEFVVREDGPAGDVVRSTERSVRTHPGETNTTSFDLPTSDDGLYYWEVTTEDDSASDQFVVGDRPYYTVTDVDSPDVTPAGRSFDIEATIENLGHMNGGQMDVNVTIENVSANSEEARVTEHPLVLDGTAYSGATSDGTIDLTHTVETGEAGQYRYVVRTPNETVQGTFTVGAPETPNFVVSEVDTPSEAVDFQSSETVGVTVENLGERRDTQQIRVRNATGTELWTETVVLGAGEQTTIERDIQFRESHFRAGYNEITIETNNQSSSAYVEVRDLESIDDDDGEIQVNERVRAQITVLGAELELNRSIGYDDSEFIVRQDPVHMWLDIENGSTGEEEIVWLFQDAPTEHVYYTREHGGDVNHPAAEAAMVRDVNPYDPGYSSENPYNRTVTLPENSTISVFAESQYCADNEETDVEYSDIEIFPGERYDASAQACDWGGSRITIDHSENPSNVVILEDGQEVPSYGEADTHQRGLDDMLGSRISDDGTLSLARGERVFLYELSQENADPDNADEFDDPDYNDAVALFQVVEVERDVESPPNVVIEDVQAPNRVTAGDSGELTVSVNNTGGQTANSNILVEIAGLPDQSISVQELEPGERREVSVSFSIPGDTTDDVKPFTAYVGDDPSERTRGYMTIGHPETSLFQIDDVSGPSVVEHGVSPTFEVTVTNTGGARDTQEVALGSQTKSLTLDPGETDSVEFDISSPSMGEHFFDVETENTSIEGVQFTVGQSDVHINEIEIGGTTYNEDQAELIERREAQVLTVNVENRGTIGAERTVSLEIEDGDGDTVYPDDPSDDDTQTVQLGTGEISDDFPAWVSYDVDLDTGYYEYTIEVEGSTPGATTKTWNGEILIQEDADVGGSQNSSSPVGVDENEVTVGD